MNKVRPRTEGPYATDTRTERKDEHMIETTAKDLFLLPKNETEAAVVTTNGQRKRDGKAVMGAGIAKYVRDNCRTQRLRTLGHMDTEPFDETLGRHLAAYGNRAFWMGQCTCSTRKDGTTVAILTMPTKHDWRNDSDLGLIVQSARQLVELADWKGLTKVYLPRPGCTNGKLDWESTVKPAIECILDDRFTVVSQP